MSPAPKKAAVRRPAAKKAAPKPAKAPEGNDRAAVDAFFAKLSHPLKTELLAVRAAFLAADPAISEGIKWNSPSFYRNGWFATMNLRAKGGLQIILHLGAKVRAGADAKGAIADPAGLLEWLGPDRASVILRDSADVQERLTALKTLARDWSRQLA